MNANGVVIGIIADTGSGVTEMLRASGGSVFRAGEAVDMTPANTVAIDYALDMQDAATRAVSEWTLELLRRGGSRVLIASHDRDLLRRISDEVWWFDAGSVRQKGDPGEVLTAYAVHTAE